MWSCSHHHQNMKDLMRAPPDIISAWWVSFWPSRLFVSAPSLRRVYSTHSIKSSSKNVEESLQQHPRKSYTFSHILHSIHLDPVKNWHQSWQPHANKHCSSIWSPRRSSETFKDWHCSTCQPDWANLKMSVFIQEQVMVTYHSPVNLLQVRMTIKTIEDTRDETSSDHEDNPNIIKLVPKSGCKVRMVGNGMICSGHPETYRCSGKETSKGDEVWVGSSFISCCKAFVKENSSDDETNWW